MPMQRSVRPLRSLRLELGGGLPLFTQGPSRVVFPETHIRDLGKVRTAPPRCGLVHRVRVPGRPLHLALVNKDSRMALEAAGGFEGVAGLSWSSSWACGRLGGLGGTSIRDLGNLSRGRDTGCS